MSNAPESTPSTPTQASPRNQHSHHRRVAGWREHHGWSAAASLRRLAARPFGSLLTIAVMGLALTLPLAFYLLLGNVQHLGDALGQNQAVSVFLQPGQDAQQAQLLARQLDARPEVVKVTVKTPQQGLDELAKMQGFSSALKTLDHNPLPYVLQLQLRPGEGAVAIERLAAEVRALDGVDMVQDIGRWRQRLDALLRVGNRTAVVLAALLALAALLVVGNTVRMDIASRSEEINVLLLLGASGAFVRRPYLYAGIWYGLFSGSLAALLALMIEFALATPVAELSRAYDGKLQIGGVPPALLLAVPLASAVLGWLGARVVSAWQLRQAS